MQALSQRGIIDHKYISIHFYNNEILIRENYFRLMNVLNADILIAHQINSFFFVLYNDDLGPHIRLRILASDVSFEVLKEILKYYHDRTHVVPSKYKPESDRYGGVELMEYVEIFFQNSSKTIITMMNIFENWRYENSLLFSVFLIKTLLSRLDLKLANSILHNYTMDWAIYCHEQDYVNRLEFLNLRIDDLIEEVQYANLIFEELSDQIFLNEFLLSFQNILVGNIVQTEIGSIIKSLLHMTCNKLGVLNKDEVLVGLLSIRIVNE